MSRKHFQTQSSLEGINKCICTYANTTIHFPQPNQPLPSPGDTVLSFLTVCLTPVITAPCPPPTYQLSIRVQSIVTLSFISAHWLWLQKPMLLTGILSCCVKRARFCKCNQSGSKRQVCCCYNRIQCSRWKGIHTHTHSFTVYNPCISKGSSQVS